MTPRRRPSANPARTTADPKLVRFARGMAIGALVGAAIAGAVRHRAGQRHSRTAGRAGLPTDPMTQRTDED